MEQWIVFGHRSLYSLRSNQNSVPIAGFTLSPLCAIHTWHALTHDIGAILRSLVTRFRSIKYRQSWRGSAMCMDSRVKNVQCCRICCWLLLSFEPANKHTFLFIAAANRDLSSFCYWTEQHPYLLQSCTRACSLRQRQSLLANGEEVPFWKFFEFLKNRTMMFALHKETCQHFFATVSVDHLEDFNATVKLFLVLFYHNSELN